MAYKTIYSTLEFIIIATSLLRSIVHITRAVVHRLHSVKFAIRTNNNIGYKIIAVFVLPFTNIVFTHFIYNLKVIAYLSATLHSRIPL